MKHMILLVIPIYREAFIGEAFYRP